MQMIADCYVIGALREDFFAPRLSENSISFFDALRMFMWNFQEYSLHFTSSFPNKLSFWEIFCSFPRNTRINHNPWNVIDSAFCK